MKSLGRYGRFLVLRLDLGIGHSGVTRCLNPYDPSEKPKALAIYAV